MLLLLLLLLLNIGKEINTEEKNRAENNKRKSSNVSLIKRYTPEEGTIINKNGNMVQWIAQIALDQKPILFIVHPFFCQFMN